MTTTLSNRRSLLILLLFLGPCAEAAEYSLPPLIVEGTPADALTQDFVLPAHAGSFGITSGTGTIQNSLFDQIALPVSDTSKPGQLTTFRGLGRQAEDTDVEALGVPLNYAQGGGFDLSTFPEFVWSGFTYQIGPSLGLLDPRASSGTLNLMPWSQKALITQEKLSRVTLSYSGAGITQESVATRVGSAAGVLGVSEGKLRGPSGALSAHWGFGSTLLRLHLLGTDVDADIPGSIRFPSPKARQKTVRLIPIAQLDTHPSESIFVKSSVYYDGTNISYDDPNSVFYRQGRVKIRQVGIENALFWSDFKLGVSDRRVSMNEIGFDAPPENVLNLQISRAFGSGGFLIEPTAQGVGVNGSGFFPEGSIGARYELGGRGLAVFARQSYSRKIPTLVDRYFVDSFYIGNRDLKPERDWTSIFGFELKESEFETTLQGYHQLRQDSQVVVSNPTTFISSPQNSGQATVDAILNSLALRLGNSFDVLNSLTWTSSHVEATGVEFPYLPAWSEVLTLNAHPRGENPPWSAVLTWRAALKATVNSATSVVHGYGIFDVGLRGRVLSIPGGLVDAICRVENLGDRSIELVKDYPTQGRIVSVALSGQF